MLRYWLTPSMQISRARCRNLIWTNVPYYPHDSFYCKSTMCVCLPTCSVRSKRAFTGDTCTYVYRYSAKLCVWCVEISVSGAQEQCGTAYWWNFGTFFRGVALLYESKRRAEVVLWYCMKSSWTVVVSTECYPLAPTFHTILEIPCSIR